MSQAVCEAHMGCTDKNNTHWIGTPIHLSKDYFWKAYISKMPFLAQGLWEEWTGSPAPSQPVLTTWREASSSNRCAKHHEAHSSD